MSYLLSRKSLFSSVSVHKMNFNSLIYTSLKIKGTINMSHKETMIYHSGTRRFLPHGPPCKFFFGEPPRSFFGEPSPLFSDFSAKVSLSPAVHPKIQYHYPLATSLFWPVLQWSLPRGEKSSILMSKYQPTSASISHDRSWDLLREDSPRHNTEEFDKYKSSVVHWASR